MGKKSKLRCYACNKPLGARPSFCLTSDDQGQFVGSECVKLILAAGDDGYQPPLGGPRLYPLYECYCCREGIALPQPCEFCKLSEVWNTVANTR